MLHKSKIRQKGTKVLIKTTSGNVYEGNVLEYLGIGFYKVETKILINGKKINRFHEADFYKSSSKKVI